MSYISGEVVSSEEKLIAVARVHWVHGIKGLLWLALFVMAGGLFDDALLLLIDDIRMLDPLVSVILTVGIYVFWASLVAGASIFLFYFLALLFTEAGLTSERLIYKTGWIFVDVKQVDLEEIKAAEVDNGMFGSLLGYGTIQMDTRFIRDLAMMTLANPYEFVQLINQAREAVKNDPLNIVVEGQEPKPGEPVVVSNLRIITPGFFAAMGTPILQGRGFGPGDGPSTVRVAIVDETFAARFWPNQSAVGKRIAHQGDTSAGRWLTIVGVVPNVRHTSVGEIPALQVYESHAQRTLWSMYIVVRASVPPQSLLCREEPLLEVRQWLARDMVFRATRVYL
jgi:hypothetical protein